MAARTGAVAPEAQALDELTSHLKAQEDNMRATHGRYGQEIVNRVLERARTFRANLSEAIQTRMKVERTPEVVATQNAIRAVKQEFLNDYPGIDSSIININSFLDVEGLRYNEITGTREIVAQLGRQVPNVHDIVLQVGRHTAEYFISQEEAKDFARMYGLINPQIKQWANAVNYNRRAIDPLTTERGYFYQSPAELGDHYQTFFGRPPSDGEIQAYFSFVRLVEMDAVLRDIGIYRNMSRLGTEHC